MQRVLRVTALGFAVCAGGVACAVALMTVASVTARALIDKPIPGDVELTQFGIALSISLCLLPGCSFPAHPFSSLAPCKPCSTPLPPCPCPPAAAAGSASLPPLD